MQFPDKEPGVHLSDLSRLDQELASVWGQPITTFTPLDQISNRIVVTTGNVRTPAEGTWSRSQDHLRIAGTGKMECDPL